MCVDIATSIDYTIKKKSRFMLFKMDIELGTK